MSSPAVSQLQSQSGMRAPKRRPAPSVGGAVVRRLRLRQRKSVSESIVIEHGGRHLAAWLIDISDVGAGFTASAALIEGDPVVIHFPDGRCLQGQVRWVEGERAGIEFTAPPVEPRIAPAGDARQTAIRPWSAALAAFIDLGSRLAAFGDARRRRSAENLMRRACRENGMAWLTDNGAVDEITSPNGRRGRGLGNQLQE